jgi:hypothetical protein
MRVELKDGQWADLRDQVTGGDRRAAKHAIQLHINEDGSRELTGDLDDQVKYVLLRRLIVDWSYPPPLPRDAVDWEGVIDKLDDDDLGALYEAVQPVYDRVLASPKRKIISGSVVSTGSSDEVPAQLTTTSPNTTGTPSDTSGPPA